ncbi:hypothetical protein [Xanthobacter sediminis]|uniref:hypothetical protein n=1 Tax=Xanthobacter sediminis TaxID=3119926 RepID=UPI0037277C10
MADYYPLLARAVSSLPQNTAEARKAVFDRARTALLRQLRGVDPPLPEGEITRERLGLEEAIRRLEAEHAPQDNVKAEAGPQDVAAPASVEPQRPGPAPEDARAAEPAPAAPPQEETAPAETPAASSQPAEESSAEAAPPRRGVVRRGEVRSREPAAPVRPSVRAAEPRKASGLRFALWAVLALVVLGGIVAAVVGLGLFSSGTQQTAQTPPAAAPAAPAEQPKSEDRVASTTGEAARRAPAPTSRAVGTQRAVLLEESPGGASPPQTFEGTVTWKTETFNAGPGLPPDIGIHGEIVIPERQISVGFVLRRNTDQTLPATHTIEISFKLPQDFAFGGVANVPGVRAKQSQQAQGVPLAGLAVKVSPTLFLVGLSTAPSDRQRNLALLQLYPWFDVPVVYTNNKKAVIVFEKGTPGQQAFNDAFSAWGELIQAPPQQDAPAAQKNGE